MRQALSTGAVEIAGTATINGRRVYRVVDAPGFQPLSGIGDFDYYFDAETFAPVRLVSQSAGGDQVTDFTLYEFLPADESAATLASLQATYPDAVRTTSSESADQIIASRCDTLLASIGR